MEGGRGAQWRAPRSRKNGGEGAPRSRKNGGEGSPARPIGDG
jgi:hypothetical protein